ncbi:MAG TPA: DUF305 domain-containing protein [Gemmatirosa sp.]
MQLPLLVFTTTTRRLVLTLSPLIAAGCLAAGCALARPAVARASGAHTAATSTQPDSATAGHDMADMDMGNMRGHVMEAPVRIPPGALFTEADVRFMQGMIAHHGQAIHMARLATTRGASPRVLRFAQKLNQSQGAEIRLMQEWLVANGQPAPDTGSWRGMTMPGMLTAAQLAALEAAHGAEFDAQFLGRMIQHHEGALRMVADLLATPRAAQDVDVSVLANDVETTQTAEIGLMRQMLSALRVPSTGAR